MSGVAGEPLRETSHAGPWKTGTASGSVSSSSDQDFRFRIPGQDGSSSPIAGIRDQVILIGCGSAARDHARYNRHGNLLPSGQRSLQDPGGACPTLAGMRRLSSVDPPGLWPSSGGGRLLSSGPVDRLALLQRVASAVSAVPPGPPGDRSRSARMSSTLPRKRHSASASCGMRCGDSSTSYRASTPILISTRTITGLAGLGGSSGVTCDGSTTGRGRRMSRRRRRSAIWSRSVSSG